MDDQSAIQIDLTRLVAVYLGKGVPAGSIGLELLTLGIVMLTNGKDFRQLAKETNSSDCSVQAGHSAIG